MLLEINLRYLRIVAFCNLPSNKSQQFASSKKFAFVFPLKLRLGKKFSGRRLAKAIGKYGTTGAEPCLSNNKLFDGYFHFRKAGCSFFTSTINLAHVIWYLMSFISFIYISFFVRRGLPKSQREKEKTFGKNTMRVIHCIKSLYSVHLKYTKIDKGT